MIFALNEVFSIKKGRFLKVFRPASNTREFNVFLPTTIIYPPENEDVYFFRRRNVTTWENRGTASCKPVETSIDLDCSKGRMGWSQDPGPPAAGMFPTFLLHYMRKREFAHSLFILLNRRLFLCLKESDFAVPKKRNKTKWLTFLMSHSFVNCFYIFSNTLFSLTLSSVQARGQIVIKC